MQQPKPLAGPALWGAPPMGQGWGWPSGRPAVRLAGPGFLQPTACRPPTAILPAAHSPSPLWPVPTTPAAARGCCACSARGQTAAAGCAHVAWRKRVCGQACATWWRTVARVARGPRTVRNTNPLHTHSYLGELQPPTHTHLKGSNPLHTHAHTHTP